MNAITKILGGSISLIYIIRRGWLSLIHWICFVVSVCYWISFFCCNNEEHFWLHWPLYFQFFWRNHCFFVTTQHHLTCHLFWQDLNELRPYWRFPVKCWFQSLVYIFLLNLARSSSLPLLPAKKPILVFEGVIGPVLNQMLPFTDYIKLS